MMARGGDLNQRRGLGRGGREEVAAIGVLWSYCGEYGDGPQVMQI